MERTYISKATMQAMERTYISKATMQAMGLPIGDPFGGAVYGKKEMPFAAIGAGITGALASAGGAIAGGAAALAGAVGATGVAGAIGGGLVAGASAGAIALSAVATISVIATVAGLAMTVVGAITGDRDLMKIGGYVGLAGGVAGMASGAIYGISAGATAAAEGATTAAQTAAQSAAPAASLTSPASSIGGMAGTAGQGAFTGAKSALYTAGSEFASGAVSNAAAPAVSNSYGLANAAQSIGNTAGNALPITGSGIGQNVGAEAAKDLAVQAVKAPATPSFFDGIGKRELFEGGTVIAGMLSGSAKQDADIKDNVLERDKFNYDKLKAERNYTNANTQGQFGLTTRQPTPEEIAAYKMQQAQAARQQAGLLTAPAGS